MAGQIKHYFACANSAKGFRNLFDSNINNLDKVYILKGGPGTGKSSLMKKIGYYFLNQEIDAEYIHCSSDPHSLDGVIFRKLSLAILDGTAPHIIEPTAPGAIEEYINLGTAWNTQLLEQHKEEILNLQHEISSCYPKAYAKFSEALDIHDEWEKIYIRQMNFDQANRLTHEVAEKLLGEVSFNKNASIMHRFFGGSTPEGPLDYVDQLTLPLSKRYFIKGRPGSGKSTMLKKILEVAQEKGVDTEVYHCGFDPDSLDMLLFPELSLCIFDSTAPHEYFPSRDTDEVIDMYEKLITPHTDEIYYTQLLAITSHYKEVVSEGTSYLAEAKSLHDDLEKYYVAATDFSKVNSIYNDLLTRINSRL